MELEQIGMQKMLLGVFFIKDGFHLKYVPAGRLNDIKAFP